MRLDALTIRRSRYSFLFAAVLLGGCAAAPMKESISSKDAPAPIGPYSPGVKVGGWLFLAGQTAIDPKTNQLGTGSIEEQTKQTLENLKDKPPARATVQVAKLPRDALVEISAIALK